MLVRNLSGMCVCGKYLRASEWIHRWLLADLGGAVDGIIKFPMESQLQVVTLGEEHEQLVGLIVRLARHLFTVVHVRAELHAYACAYAPFVYALHIHM